MISESIKKRLNELGKPQNSQTIQSGFSASAESRIDALRPQLDSVRASMENERAAIEQRNATQKATPVQSAFSASDIEAGKKAWEDYKLEQTGWSAPSDESWFEKLGRYLSGATADTSTPLAGVTGVTQTKIENPEKALEIGRLTDSQRDEFYARFGKDKDDAQEWAKAALESNNEAKAEEIYDWAKEHPVLGNVASLAPMRAAGADYFNALTDAYAGTNFYDPKDVENPTAFMATARAGAKEGSWLGTNPVGQYIDDVVYSSIQSLWSNMISGGNIGADKFSSLPLAFYSASSTTRELMLEGYDAKQASIIASLHGTVAFITEALGSDTLIAKMLKNTKLGESAKQFAKRTFKAMVYSFLSEAVEEAAEDISDWTLDGIVDLFFERGASDFARYKAEELATGGENGTSTSRAIFRLAKELVSDFFAGGLSGGLMAGTSMVKGQATEAYHNTKSVYDYTKTKDKSNLVSEIRDVEGRLGGEYSKLSINKGQNNWVQTLRENYKVGKALATANRDIDVNGIENELISRGVSEDIAKTTAEAIYRSAREATTTSQEDKLLKTEEAKSVLDEYTRSIDPEDGFSADWVKDIWRAQKYTSTGEPTLDIDKIEELREFRKSEQAKEIKAAKDARIAEYRKEQLAPYADKYGLDIADILDQHSDITTTAYRKAIQDSFNLASAGYTLEQVQKTVQLPMEGVLLKAYNNGVTAYAKSKGAAPTQRVNIRSNAKIELASESDVARNAPNAPYKAVNLDEVKTKKPKVYAGMLFLSKFVAPRINRKIVFFDGGANTGGWRTADSIGINIGGSFELYRKTGNVVGLFMHEFGHDLRADSQELYDELRQIIINDVYKGDAARFDAEVRAEMSSRATVKSQFGEGAELDYINAEEEIIGNALAKIAESPESLERVFAENKGKQSIQKLFDMLKKLIGDIKEFFASFGHANSIADIIDEDALSKIEGVLQRYVEQIDNTPVGRIAESLPTDTTEITDVADATKYSIVSFAEGCGFKIDPETHAWQLKFPATRVTPTDIRNSPIGALIMFSKEMGDIGERGGITEKEANDQIQMFTDIANMCIESADFSMTMQFVGSSMFTGLKANADKQYGTTFDFPSICTKTQAVIDAMSREMVRKRGGLTKEEIAVIYTKVWIDNNPVPCPECYVFSRWVGIGGLLNNIWHFQNIYSKMTPEQVRAEYKKYDAIFAKQVEELNAKKKSSDKVLTKNQIRNEQKKKYEKEYASLVEKQQKAQDGGAPFTEADEARLKEITPIYDTLRSMTYIQKVYFADDKMAVVNKNAFVPSEVLFDLNEGENFAKKYPEAWAFRTTQGAIYGKAITPYAEEVLGEGIIGVVNVTKQANAKAKFGRETSDNITERKSNPFLESKGELTADARKTLMTARKKQLNQAYIGGQRFQSISDARYENFLDYLIAALEVQAMGGMVQMYTKVSGAVEATNAWGFSNNQSLMPKGGGIVNGVIQDTAHGGMRPSVAFENRQKFEYAGTITIGVNDEHIRAMFGDVNRDFIIPYHASGGDRLLIAAMRATLDPDANVVQSTDYTKEQSEKILNDSLLDDPADVHKFREQRLAILTRKGNLDMDYINAPGNELLRRVYDSVNSGIYEGATVAKGVCEAQIFPNEYWDTSLSYEESGKIVEDYLEYCRRLGFLHKFSGKTQTYDRKTNTYKLTQLNGRDAQGKEVPLTDLAYKNGNPEDGVEPYYWKVLVDRRMYGNNGQYLQQRTIKVTADTAKYATTFAGGKENQNAGSVRAYSKEKSDRTLSWVDKGGVRDSVMALKDKGIELKSLPLRGEEVSKLFAPKTKSELQTKWSTRRYFEDSDAQKLASENPLINAIFETIKSSASNTASGKFLEDVYREHPELNFTGRIQENPKGEATERFRNLVNSINDVELIDDIRWFVPEFHRKLYDDNGVFMGRDYSYAKKHSKAIKLIRQICDERIESLKDAGGTNLGIKAGTAFDVKDIRNLFESWNTHAELNDLANKVFDLAERLNIAVVAVNDKNASLGDYANLGYWHGNASRYGTGKTGLVAYQLPVFNAKTISDDSKAQIILHEMIHACTANILHAVQLLDLTQEQVDAIQPYVNLINEGMYHLKTNQKWTPSTPNMYGMKNIHEFLAELSNPEFRKALASVDDKSIKEVMVYEQTLRPWINATNLETYSVSVLEKLLSDFSMEVYTEFSNRRKYRVTSDTPKYSVRREAPPQKTERAYKLMRYVDGKFYPLFIGNTEEIKPGVWYNADSPDLSQLKSLAPGTHLLNIETGDSITWDQYAKRNNLKRTKPNVADIKWASANGYRFMYIEDKAGTASEGRMARQYGDTRAYYNWGINGSSKSKTGEGSAQIYALRPGWHFGELPSMQQIGYGDDEDKFRLDNQVWVEVEMAADVDYSEEAASNYSGDIPDHIPYNGYYTYATNPVSKKTKGGNTEADRTKADWYVSGAFKIVRAISDSEADAIVNKYNAEHGTNIPLDYRRQNGKVFNANTMSLEDAPKFSERRVTWFYSQMGRVIEQQKADKFDARSLINMLLGKGVKAEEIKWSGLPAFLEGKKSVSKSDLMEFIEGSTLDVTEEMLSGDETRHKGYTIEGDYSDNYREFLFKWSNLGYSNDYMDWHWGQSNVLAHARVDDTKDSEGSDVLFIEEIQSDWHNAATAAKGYMSSDDFEKKKKMRQPISYFGDWLGDAYDAYGGEKQNSGPRIDEFNVKMKEFGAPWRIMFDHGAYNLREGNKVVLKGETWGGFLDELWDVDFTDYEEVGNELYGTMPPEAPFKNNKYTDFVVKNMLHRAAEEGYEKIAWTTAKTQSDRWSDEYSKAYEIEYDHDIPKYLEKFGKQWGVKPTHEKLENGVIAWTFPITDAMQNSVVYEGQPMYSMRRIEDHTTIKSGSLFSGGGLLEQGLEYQLLTHEFGVEYDASIAATWKENNGDGKIYAGKAEGNVFNFDGKQYKGKMFHIHASPVCHNLSPAKHGYGEQPSDIESAKKTLQIFLDAEAPVYTVENAALYAKTESARIIKEGLENAGYKVDIGVYNSADYGSAQSRTRTIIRAIRGDLMMPDRPRTLPRTRTWDQVTRDLWDGLERITENDIQEGYRNAVRKTGIDINNVKVPTLLLQTTTAGKVSYAVEGTQSPTLTTHCYDSKLLLPGGIICNVTPQFMGRLMGLPDDFQYPHWKDGTLKKTVPYKIIGNGIPVELTKAVVGGVIESAYEQTEGRSLYSIRRVNNDLSPREYLTQAVAETMRSPKERAEFESLANEYRTLDDRSVELQNKITDLNLKIDETYWNIKALDDALLETSASKYEKVTNLIKRYGSASEAMKELRADLRKSQDELRELRKKEAEVEDKMSDILTIPLVERIVDEQRKLTREYEELLESTKAADQQKLKSLRATMDKKIREEIDRRIQLRKDLIEKYNNRELSRHYLSKIATVVKDLQKNVQKAPVPFRTPVYMFLSTLDTTTKLKSGELRPGQANLDRIAVREEMLKLLGDREGSIPDWLAKYGVELSEDFTKWIDDTRNYLEWKMLNKEEVNLRNADPEQLKSVYNFAAALNREIKNFSKGYTNTVLNQSENSREIVEHIEPLERENTKVGRIEQFMNYANAQAPTVFDRLGEGGKKLFSILADGADKYALNRKVISDFASDWNQKQVREWMNPKDPVNVPFTTIDKDGNEVVENVPMTPAQMMTLYETLQDPDGWRHIINGEGFQLDRIKFGANGKKGEQIDTTRKMTVDDYNALVDAMNAYDPNLIPFADKLHDFIHKQGGAWGNQVSIARYGFEQFTQPNYFPLYSVEKGKANTIDAIYSAMRRSFYGLLNRSFTKERLPHAVNALIIGDIFDIFIEHMSDMALYNAYALPVLEVNRFLNYVEYESEKDEDGKEKFVEKWKIKDKLDKAFGTDMIQNYIKKLFDSINGQEYLSREDSLFLMGLRLRNRVAVTANLRVVVQQFFSIIRAGEVIPAKYFDVNFDFKKAKAEMYEHAPVALWKKQGNYNTDIKIPLREELIGANTGYGRFVNAASKYGMTPAEFMDEVAWTNMWHAVTNWVSDTNPELTGDAFYAECNKRFRDIIYRTQVVDSVLQKSQFMRQQTFEARALSSFKGEPTTSYNQLLRVYDMYKDAKRRGDVKTAWATIRPLALRAITAYCLNALANALVTSIADMFRDDDDYETMWEKFIEALFGEYRKKTWFWRKNMTFPERARAFAAAVQAFLRSNLVESFNPLDIPLFSDIFSLFQGYEDERSDLMLPKQILDLANGVLKSLDGIDAKLVYDIIGAVSQVLGLPIQNVMRDSLATWNSVVGIWNELFGTTLNMKVQITPESAQSGYEALYDAMSKGKESRTLELVTEIMENVKDSDKAYAGITTQIRDAYKHDEITAEQAHDYLIAAYSYFDVHKKSYDTPEKLDKHIKDQVSGWDK